MPEVLTNVKNKQGKYSTLDIAPTILDLQNYYGGHNNSLLNEKIIALLLMVISCYAHLEEIVFTYQLQILVTVWFFKNGFYVALDPSRKSKAYSQV